MSQSSLAWNYAIVRFLPYPEVEEFVSMGAVVACPETRVFDFRIETEQTERVTRFYPTLDPHLLIAGRDMFVRELARVRECLCGTAASASPTALTKEEFSRSFCELVKPRESIFRFGGVGTLLAASAEEALDHLFSAYVQRRQVYPFRAPQSQAVADASG